MKKFVLVFALLFFLVGGFRTHHGVWHGYPQKWDHGGSCAICSL